MSLKEKLRDISKEAEAQKVAEAKAAENEAPAPVRERIADLKKERHQLEVLLGSLRLKSSGGSGTGMREHQAKTAASADRESKNISKLYEEHRTVLEPLDIISPEAMVVHPEFKEEDEAVQYRAAQARAGELVQSDEALQSRLAALNVSLGEDEFTYDVAERAVAGRLALLETELMQSQVKTPEGRVEAIARVAGELRKMIPRLSVEHKAENKISSYRINFAPAGFRAAIVVDASRVRFEDWDWNEQALVPVEELSRLEGMIDRTFAEDALAEVYRGELDQSFSKLPENNGFAALEKDVERASREKFDAARKGAREIEILRAALLKKLENAKGSSFNDALGAHGATKTFADFYGYKNDWDKVNSFLQGEPTFPPPFDYEKFLVDVERYKGFASEVTAILDAVGSGSTEKYTTNDVSRLVKSKGSWYSEWYHRHGFKSVSSYPAFSKEPVPVARVEEDVKRRKKEQTSIQDRVVGALGQVADLQLVRKDLKREIEAEKFGNPDYPESIAEEEQRVVRNRASAGEFYANACHLFLERLTTEHEPVGISGGGVTVSREEEKYRELYNEMYRKNPDEHGKRGLQKEIESLEEKTDTHKTKEPKFFTGNWKKEGVQLDDSLVRLREEWSAKRNELNEISRKSEFPLLHSDFRNYEVEAAVKNVQMQGEGKEVLAKLYEAVSPFIHATIPAELVAHCREYADRMGQIKKEFGGS
ncbi:MAG: hypothetical protein Q7S84_00590 [bacterium]|nr:hypothetical protein [bacterium]